MSDVVLLDGATGSELRVRGVEVPSHVTSVWSAQALWQDPDVVVDVHRAYIDAGADVVTANNYAVTRPLLGRVEMGDRVPELVLRSLELAERARDKGGRDVRIAGSLPPLDTSYEAGLVGGQEGILAQYREIAALLAPRVDLILCETLSCAREARAAATAAAETGAEFWVAWTLQGNAPDHLPSGETVQEAFDALSDLGASAYLVNCCGANLVTRAIPLLAGLTDRPVGGYANSVDVSLDGSGSSPPKGEALDVEAYARAVSCWLEAGARIVGGCCSTGPAHIARLRRLIDGE